MIARAAAPSADASVSPLTSAAVPTFCSVNGDTMSIRSPSVW